jgi:hypothetical protein
VIFEHPYYPHQVRTSVATLAGSAVSHGGRYDDPRAVLSESLTLVSRQDADFGLVLNCVVSHFAARPPAPPGMEASAWFSLGELARVIDSNYANYDRDGKREVRRRVWRYLRFGAASTVVGARSYVVKRRGGERLTVRVSGPIWHVGEREEHPAALRSDRSSDAYWALPAYVKIIMERTWVKTFTESDLRQYVPFAERLAKIPGRQPAGAWARSIGQGLMEDWRRNPPGKGRRYPRTREWLLTHLLPRTSPLGDPALRRNPARVVDYYAGALRTLVEFEVLADEGEALLASQHRPGNPILRSKDKDQDKGSGKGWLERWLQEEPVLEPHEDILKVLLELAGR